MFPPNLVFKGEIECSCGDVRRIKRPVNAGQLEKICTKLQERHGSCDYQQELPQAEDGQSNHRTVTLRRAAR